MDAGFTDYLAKPAGPETVRETVARLLREAAGESLQREESA